MTRLIDLHCDWPLQYAGETTVYDPTLYQDIGPRIGQAEGYLTGTSAAVLACYRRAADWASRPDPWAALDPLITRIEAEFPGRLLTGPGDLGRWKDDPEGLCWGLIGVEGFDALVRSADDLGRLAGLLRRGVRVFQPVYGPESLLGGSSAVGDDRGLTDLGLAFLDTLADLSAGAGGVRPALDLAHLNPTSMAAALDWFEADPSRPDRLVPVYSHGAPRHDGFDSPRAITPDNLRRLRALGGRLGFSVGPPFFSNQDALQRAIEEAASVPFQGREGYDGLAIGTDFLGVAATLPGLGNVEEVTAWIHAKFGPEAGHALTAGNASALIMLMLATFD